MYAPPPAAERNRSLPERHRAGTVRRPPRLDVGRGRIRPRSREPAFQSPNQFPMCLQHTRSHENLRGSESRHTDVPGRRRWPRFQQKLRFLLESRWAGHGCPDPAFSSQWGSANTYSVPPAVVYFGRSDMVLTNPRAALASHRSTGPNTMAPDQPPTPESTAIYKNPTRPKKQTNNPKNPQTNKRNHSTS